MTVPRQRFRSPARRAALGLALLALAACGLDDPAGPSAAVIEYVTPPDGARPNVILISIDTLRADHLSSHGYERETSPHLDRLAAEGVRFEDCVSTTSWTLPAHMSMLTGLEISAHGICEDRLWARANQPPLPLRGTFMPEVLRTAGWRTAGFYSGEYLKERFGFGPGFELYERIGRTFWWRQKPEWIERYRAFKLARDSEGAKAWQAAEPAIFDKEKPLAGDGVDQTTAWIEGVQANDPDQPFFVFLHLFDVHTDYRPPAPYDTLFDADYTGAIDGTQVSPADSPVRRGMDKRDLEHVIALYDGEIAWVDSQLGRLFAWLDERGLAEDTLIIVTSDHGEEFFEHGNKLHRNNLERESLHVPLIMRWPAGLTPGLVVEAPTGIVDIAPTVYSLLDVAPPAGLSGIDLGPLCRGEQPPERELVSELVRLDKRGRATLVLGLHGEDSQVTRRSKAGETESIRVHDLGTDPAGRRNGQLVQPGSNAGADIERRVDVLRVMIQRRRDKSRVVGGEAVPLDEAELSDLSALGYVVSGEDASQKDGPGEARLCLDGCVWH